MAEYRRVSAVLKGIKSGSTEAMNGVGSLPLVRRLGRGLTETQFRAAATGNAQSRADYGGHQAERAAGAPSGSSRTGEPFSVCLVLGQGGPDRGTKGTMAPWSFLS